MSTLTKVFAVLLVVFSIFFTAMTISVVAQTTNWRDLATKYEQHAKVADTNLRNALAGTSAQLAMARDAVTDSVKKLGDVEAQMAARSNELNQVRAESAKVQTELSTAQAMNRGLLNQLQVAEDQRSEYRKQRDDLEKRGIDLERRNVDLNDRVNELTANMAVLMEEKRQFEQQINILRTENDRTSRSGGRSSAAPVFEAPGGVAMRGVSAATPVSGARIQGQVTRVDGDLVEISVGSADGVQKDMVFDIARGSEYVGSIQVLAVEPNQAAGRLTRSTSRPAAGDLARDTASVAGAPR